VRLFPPAAFNQPQTGLSPALHTLGFEMVFFGLGLAAVTLGWSLLVRTCAARKVIAAGPSGTGKAR
jgi:hypothetical protein